MSVCLSMTRFMERNDEGKQERQTQHNCKEWLATAGVTGISFLPPCLEMLQKGAGTLPTGLTSLGKQDWMDQLFIKREWKAYLFTQQINVILMSFI